MTRMNKSEALMTFKEVAVYLRYSGSKTYEMFRRGAIPTGRKIDGQWRADRESVVKWAKGEEK
jgi:excisionase family DNA binding protein